MSEDPLRDYPLQHARTRRFTLGVPRAFTSAIGPDGPFVLFLRSRSGTDPTTHLWRLDLVGGVTTLLVDATRPGDEDLPAEERARRERAREQAGGIVAYATDRQVRVAAFTLGGQLHTLDVVSGRVAVHPTAGPAFDARPSPDGRRVAYHADGGLHVVDLLDGPGAPGIDRPLAVEEGVSFGRAEFIAAEEMQRTRGFWWSGDGSRLAVARVDERRVPTWTIADPSAPWTPPAPHRYPAAGTDNADVSLWIVDAAEPADRRRVPFDHDAFPYLASVGWGSDPLTVLFQSRDQRRATIHVVDPDTATSRHLRTLEDEAWVELVPGSPGWAGDTLVTVEDRHDRGHGGTRSLCFDGTPVTPVGLQVREVVAASAQLVVFLASGDDPTQVHVHRIAPTDPSAAVWSTTSEEPGVHREAGGHDPRAPWVRVSATLARTAPRITVHGSSGEGTGSDLTHHLEVVASEPGVQPRPQLLELGVRRLRGALFLPADDDGSAALPVLLDPYGGPHAQRVLQAGAAHLTSQWLADQGMAVLVVDGRGTPGRGPSWERAIHGDLATPVLDDQVDALHAAARHEPRLDLRRVAIRGWSFGGTLAALAVLRRPDVFHAAIVGAPVTDWRLYDTHYTERYLGLPDAEPQAYRRSSVVDADGRLVDAVPPPGAAPELLLIHGLADDNVVAAHALRLSSALLTAGRAHRFLPLPGVTHMTPQEDVAASLLRMQLAFLQEVFGLSSR